MPLFDLGALPWTLEGWRPFSWRLGRSREAQAHIRADVGPLPAQVPGSVQQALKNVGVLPDWHLGLNSRLCEWVEHRHWIYETELPAGLVPRGQPVFLTAEALDYSGWVLVDGEEAATFGGVLVPHRIELSGYLDDGAAHRLTLVFDLPPEEQGQIGYSSRSRYYKPRFNYSWDWCPRFVPVGIAGPLLLEIGYAAQISVAGVATSLAENVSTGAVCATIEVEYADATELFARVSLTHDGRQVAALENVALTSEATEIQFDSLPVEPWWPNGMGHPSVYELEVTVLDADGGTIWEAVKKVGFRRLTWRPCSGAPEDAEPWICEINDEPVFLQGVNWTPIRMAWGDVLEAEYRERIELYRMMGVNLFRVWGGAQLESETFYDLCDEAGILVWQEFPLSSSGLENLPPHDEDAIEDACVIARSYIRRRRHHPSLAIWCGGNELADARLLPVDDTHPCIEALLEVVAEEDPGRRFLHTSPSGPRFGAAAEDFGRSIHHDVHGPWGWGGFSGMDAWRAYWAEDDALFRSEVGMPGAADLGLIQQHSAGLSTWPPITEYWMHTAAWWTQWERLSDELSDAPAQTALQEYVRRTQAEQAEAYAIAAHACKSRFPRCGGFLVWMGHDCFPCPANNSILDFLGRPKPAYFALMNIFKQGPGAQNP